MSLAQILLGWALGLVTSLGAIAVLHYLSKRSERKQLACAIASEPEGLHKRHMETVGKYLEIEEVISK